MVAKETISIPHWCNQNESSTTFVQVMKPNLNPTLVQLEFRASRKGCRSQRVISIPHWCNQNTTGSEESVQVFSISIPHWCNQNLHQCMFETDLEYISIPHWCNQNTILWQPLNLESFRFQSHIGAIRIEIMRKMWKAKVIEFQSHIGAIRM